MNRDPFDFFAPVGDTTPKVEAVKGQTKAGHEKGKEEDKEQQPRKYPEQNGQQHQDNSQNKGQKEPTSRYSPVYLIGHGKSPLY